MRSLVRPELPTASAGSSQAPTATVDNSAPSATRPHSTYKSGKAVQTNGATSLRRHAVQRRRIGHAQASFADLSNNLDWSGIGQSGMLVGVHSADVLEAWVFGDFHSSRLSPGEPQVQRIEASHLPWAGQRKIDAT